MCSRIKLSVALLCVATGWLSSASTNVSANAEADTALAVVRDTVIVGCELYWFGNRMPRVVHDGRSGHYIARTRSTVTINGAIYFDTHAPQPIEHVSETALRHAAIIDMARDEVRHHDLRFPDTDTVIVDGIPHRIGEFVTFSTGDDGQPIQVAYLPSHFVIRYQRVDSYCNYVDRVEPSPTPPVDAETRVQRAYGQLVLSLRPGEIVMMGRGYISARSGKHQRALHAAIAEIPQKALLLGRSPDGKLRYAPLTIGEFNFSPQEVEDFVRAVSESDEQER